VSISPRQYRHKIIVEQVNPNASGDANGVVDRTDDDNWIRFAQRWATVFNRGGREVYRAQQVQTNASHVVRTPFDSLAETITTEMRIAYGGQKLNVISVSDVTGERRELEIICEASL